MIDLLYDPLFAVLAITAGLALLFAALGVVAALIDQAAAPARPRQPTRRTRAAQGVR